MVSHVALVTAQPSAHIHKLPLLLLTLRPSEAPLCVATDADFIAFKQQMEGDPELLPSAEVQLDLKEQAKKAMAGLDSLQWALFCYS